MRISDWSSDVCSSDLSAAIPSSPTPVRRVRPLQAISVQRWCVLSARNIIRSLSGTLPDRRGVAAIELAFTLPVLTFLSLGAFDVARMLSAQIDYQQAARSEEHTSELQSLMRISYAVFCLKKKKVYKKE